MTLIDWSQMITAETATSDGLERARIAARADLAAWIDTARRQLITVLPGQDMIYLAKEAEARRWLADPAPNPAEYPLLSAEVRITAPDGHSLSQLWLNMSALWISAAAQLEALRLSTSAAIEAAETITEISAAMAAIQGG